MLEFRVEDVELRTQEWVKSLAGNKASNRYCAVLDL